MKVFFTTIIVLLFAFIQYANFTSIRQLENKIERMETNHNASIENLKRSLRLLKTDLPNINADEKQISTNVFDGCNFRDLKYSAGELGHISFHLDHDDRIAYTGKLKGKNINGIAKIEDNSILLEKSFWKVELILTNGCSRVKGFLELQKEDESWEIFALNLIKL